SGSSNYVLLTRLADEFAARYRAGERPSLQEYLDRYLELVGNEKAALKLLKEASEREDTKGLVPFYALTLYRKNRVEEALQVLDNGRQPGNRGAQVLRIFLLAEVHGPDRAYQAFQELASRDPALLRLSVRVPQPLLFLGKRAEAAKLRPVDNPGYAGAP